MLLSSLLGPAKPPVASREDVDSTLGVYSVQKFNELLVATSSQSTDLLHIAANERCLVCLEHYQVDEELRQLSKCSHFFHRQCIDQVILSKCA